MTQPLADGRIAAVAAAMLPRRLAAFIVAAAAALLLSSCLQMHLDLTVSTHDTISGQVRLGLQKSLLTALGGAGQLGQTLATQSSCDQAHANQSNYDDGTYVGVVCTYTDLPIAQFGKGSRDPSSGLSLTRVGDEYKLAGSIDLTKLATNSANPGIPIDAATLLSSADVRLRFTFPGPITSSTGTVSGRTVTFTAGPSGKITVQATAKARTGSVPISAFGLGIAIAAGAAGLLIALVVWVILVRRRRRTVATDPSPDHLAAAWEPGLAGVPAGQPADPNVWVYSPSGADWQRSLGEPATYPGATTSPPPYGYAAPPQYGNPATPTAPPGPDDRR
jgi:hypothetical protein